MKNKNGKRNISPHYPVAGNSQSDDPVSRAMCNAGLAAFPSAFSDGVGVGSDGSGYAIDGSSASMNVANATNATNTATHTSHSSANPHGAARPKMSGVLTENHASGITPLTSLSNSVSSADMTGAVPTPILSEADAEAYAELTGVPTPKPDAPRND